jgi:hypothetical protein
MRAQRYCIFGWGRRVFPNPPCRAAKAGTKAKGSGQVRAGGRDVPLGPRAVGDGVGYWGVWLIWYYKAIHSRKKAFSTSVESVHKPDIPHYLAKSPLARDF